MRHRRLIVATVAAAATCLAGPPPPAYAGEEDTSTGVDDAGALVAQVVVRHGGGHSAGSSNGGGDPCTWQLDNDFWLLLPSAAGPWPRTASNGTVYNLYLRTCPGQPMLPVEVPVMAPRTLMPTALEDLKEQSLPEPEPAFLALDSDFGWAYVTVPVDFRVGNRLDRVSVTASVGPVWASVTAVPSRVTFDPGEPEGYPVSCSAAGAQAGYDPAVPGECSYTYVDSSAISANGRTFDTTMSVEWTISWTSSTGAGGPLAGYTTSSSSPLAVAEIQALVTCTGPRPEQGGCG